jgi:hypothetical protein
MIFDDTGRLVWYQPIPKPDLATDFRVQTYQGRPVLTWWQGHVYTGDGFGHGEIWDSSYRPVAQVHAADGLDFDLHEFMLTPRDTALITVYQRVRADLRPYGGDRDGVLVDGLVQEIDIKTGLKLFEWNGLDHVAPWESYVPAPRVRGAQWDYFHLNGVDEDADGNLLVSGRNTWGIYKVSRATGDRIWRLGGKRSSFKLGPGVEPAWQHDPRLMPDGTLTLFDNGASGFGRPFRPASRALTVRLDTAKHTATLARAFADPHNLSAGSQGDVQRLPNGDDFVGWGAQRYFTEFGPAGQVLLEGRLSVDNTSYRMYRFPWSGRPAAPPRAVASRAGTSVKVSASWNGATGVARWQLLAGPATEAMTPVADAPATGFETTITAPTSQPLVAMRAFDAVGNAIGTSAPVKVPK